MNENTFVEENDKGYEALILSVIRGGYTGEQLKNELDRFHNNDIAGVISLLTSEERELLLSALGYEAMSAIVSYLDDAGDYLSELDIESVADIIEQMDADEAVDALDDLDEKTRNAVLSHIDNEEIKEEIKLIDSYDEECFGSRMSTNYIAIKKDMSIKQATRTLISMAADNDNIYTLFVTNDDGSFYGAIDLKSLIVARSDERLENLICTTFPYVLDKDIISDNVERLRSYSEDLIPVLSSEDRKMLGVITTMDILDMVDDELGEDYAKLAALVSEEAGDEKLFQSMKKRIPWLIVLLFMGLVVSATVGLFERVVDALPMIVSFQSLILGMAGNVGTQSLAVTVRQLGIGTEIRLRAQIMMIIRETRIAMLNGVAIGLFSFGIVSLYLVTLGGFVSGFALTVAVCVGLAMCFAMAISGLTGAAIPIALYRMGADPAVASGPLITTVNDLVAVITYYGLAWTLILNFV